LRLAGIDQEYLTDKEKVLLGFLPQIKPGSHNELANLERLCYIYAEALNHLETKEAQIGVASSPPLLKLKIQEYRNIPTQDILDTYLLSTLADAYSCLVKLTTHF